MLGVPYLVGSQHNTGRVCKCVLLRCRETGASCYRGRLLQGRFMQNYYIDGEVADFTSSKVNHKGRFLKSGTYVLYIIAHNIT